MHHHSNLLRRQYGPLQVKAGVAYVILDAKGKPKVDEEGHSVLEARYGLHALRHAAASNWIKQGIDLKRLTVWMGHSSVQVTLDTYGHLIADPARDSEIATAHWKVLLRETVRFRHSVRLDWLQCGFRPVRRRMPGIGLEAPVIAFDDDSALARGSWLIDDEKSSSPHNVSEIFCWKKDMTCAMASSTLTAAGDSKFQNVELDFLDVTSWSDDEIVIVSEGGCRRLETRIRKADQSVIQITRPNPTGKECMVSNGKDQWGIPLLREPRISRSHTYKSWLARRDADTA